MNDEIHEISEIKIGETTYQLKDTTAREGGGGGGGGGSALTYDDGYIAINYDNIS